ncbi:MAG: hypothetical protein GF331_14725 [Chitinivibrionales bacterium]|nr:hypothetical protein [Chitinivibrionales bacterium]
MDTTAPLRLCPSPYGGCQNWCSAYRCLEQRFGDWPIAGPRPRSVTPPGVVEPMLREGVMQNADTSTATRPPRTVGVHASGEQLIHMLDTDGIVLRDPLVLAISAPGIPISIQLARMLQSTYDILPAVALRLPGNNVPSFGAVSLDGEPVLRSTANASVPVPVSSVQAIAGRAHKQARRWYCAVRGYRPIPRLCNRSVILTDESLGADSRMQAAIRFVHHAGAADVIVAVAALERDSGIADILADRIIVLDSSMVHGDTAGRPTALEQKPHEATHTPTMANKQPERSDTMTRARKKVSELLGGHERRRSSAAHHKESAPATFALGEHSYNALMVDLSETGAQFQMEAHEEHSPLRKGAEITYTVKTPFGRGSFVGITRWTERRDDHLHWGVEITSVSDDPQDPLRAAMDTAF